MLAFARKPLSHSSPIPSVSHARLLYEGASPSRRASIPSQSAFIGFTEFFSQTATAGCRWWFHPRARCTEICVWLRWIIRGCMPRANVLHPPPASFHDSAKWNHGTLDARGASSLSLSRVTRLLSRVIIQCFSSTRRDVSVRERGWKEGGILFPFSPPARTDATRAIAPGKCISERCMATLPRKLRRRGHRRKGQSRAVEERR